MKRTSFAVAILAASTLVVSQAAAAATIDGGQEGVNTHNNGTTAAAGPDGPGIKWLSELIEDRRMTRDQALTFDSAGHVLVLAQYRDAANTPVEVLVAVNRSDGKAAWEAEGVEAACDVAASDDGEIFAQVQVGSEATSVIAIDASTGTTDTSRTYTPADTEDDPRMFACADGLSLLDDGTLIVVENRGRDKSVRALDTTSTPISLKWHITQTSSTMLGRAPASPDESTLYLAWTDEEDPRQVHVGAFASATGTMTASVIVPGDRFTINSGQGDTFVVDESGGILVPTQDGNDTGVTGDDTAHLTRVNPDMSVDWSISIDADDPVYPSNLGFDSLVTTDDKAIGWYNGQLIAAVNLADGSSAWTLKPDSFSNNESRIVADAAGNTYWGTFGGSWAQSADSEGDLRYSFPNCAIGSQTEAKAIGPIDADGTLYAVNEVTDSDGPNGIRVTAISDQGSLPQGTCPQEEQRLEGTNRFETGVEISQAAFPQDGSADAVVLARSDNFADALSGTPLAVQENGPLLITPPTQLRDDVRAEIRRLLGNDTSKTVYLLGGFAALSQSVESDVRAMGYNVVRIAGQDRIETAIEVAKKLDRIDAFLITTGFNFPDALAAGVAAANANGAVMLTQSEQRSSKTDAFMNSRSGVARFAIGGPAARPYSEATPVFGQNRTETAVKVAQQFFDNPSVAGLARQDDFPDSLTGGAHIALGAPDLARQGGPMLLTLPGSLHSAPAGYLCANEGSLQRVFVYGGEAAVSGAVASAAEQRIQGQGC